jgi:prepilin-type N-terminal cleavage/methylation domain-containing protein
MNTQKIQTIKNVKGFTLVELIVVITILVILGTIAFLNLGGMSAGARDSQRTSDQQIMTTQAKQGISYMAMLSGTTNVLSGLTVASIAGATGTTTSDYNAGDVNYTVLGIDKTKFQDPTSLVAYKMGATTRVGTAYEIAAKLEESSTALVMGIYKARGITGTDASTASATVGSGALRNIVLGDADIGKFKVGDTILATAGAVCASQKIAAISNDLKTLTLTSDCTVAGTIVATGLKLAAPECCYK